MNVLPTDDVPGAPPGPGVRTPFAAPPTERDNKRLWIVLGIGLAVVLVCCVGGIFGFGALVYSQNGSQVQPREAVSVVGDYLQDLQYNDYTGAYNLLCDNDQQQESMNEFQYRQSQRSVIKDYSIGQPRSSFSSVDVPVLVLRYSGPETDDFTVIRQQAGGLRICGGE